MKFYLILKIEKNVFYICILYTMFLYIKNCMEHNYIFNNYLCCVFFLNSLYKIIFNPISIFTNIYIYFNHTKLNRRNKKIFEA